MPIKQAGIGSAIGKVLKAPAGLLSKGVGAAGRVLERGATEEPLSFMGAAAMGAPMVPMIQNPLSNPQTLARKYQARQNITGFMEPPMTKLMSSVVSAADFEQSMKIKRQLEKTAAGPKNVGKMLNPRDLLMAAGILGGVGTAVGAGQQLAGHAFGRLEEKVREKSRPQRFNAMLKVDPTLREEPLAAAYFDVLDRASPYLASEPYIAAATIQSMIQTPALRDGSVPSVTPKQIQEILRTEEARQSSRFPMLKSKTPSSAGVSDVIGVSIGQGP